MNNKLADIKIGLALVMLGLLFGIGLGISFGVNEGMFEHYIEQGVAANPGVHGDSGGAGIWRYAQRAHFHATGIAAFSIGLLLLVSVSGLKKKMKSIAATCVGLGSFYPLGWFSMFLLAPSIGKAAAHEHGVVMLFTLIGVVGLLLGIRLLLSNVFLGMFGDDGES